MAFPGYDSVKESVWQEGTATQTWTQEILPLLPKDLDEYAWRLGAMTRRSGKLDQASDLLRGLLAYELCAYSFREVGAWGVLAGVADLAATSWRDRLRKSDRWLCWLHSQLISMQSTEACSGLKKAGYGPIELVDASHFKCIGKRGKTWRFHCMYSLLEQQLHQVVVTSTKEAESIERFLIQPGAIYVHDSGYGYRKQLAHTADAGALTVSAFHPATFPLEDEQGNAIDVVAWLKKQRAREGAIKSVSAYFWENGKRYAVRVVARRRTIEQKKRVVGQKKKKAQKRQKPLQNETQYLAGWSLVVTTLPATDWDEQEVLSLYRARWQIELLFKRIKQLLNKHVLNAETDETAKAKVAIILVAWLMQQDVAVQMRSLIAPVYEELEQQQENKKAEEENVRKVVSEWRLQKVSVDLFRQQVQGPLSRQKLLEHLPELTRHLVDSPRTRSQYWDRVTQILVAPERPEKPSGSGKNRKTGSALTAALA